MKHTWILPLLAAAALACGLSGCDKATDREHEHVAASWQTVTAPTCTAEGSATGSCVECGLEMSRALDKLPHAYSENVVEPTCTEAGYTRYTCSCGHTYDDARVTATGHHLKKTVTKSTCDKAGFSRYTCDCGFTYTGEHVPSKGHKLIEMVVTPTCEEAGYTRYACDCGYTYDADHTAPLGHTLTETVVAPTCEEAGYTRYACESCDYTYDADHTAPTGHKLTETVVAPTCEDAGYTHYACENCDHAYDTDHTAPTGHTLTETVTLPTCESEGYTHYDCENCDYEFEADFVAPGGHELTETKVIPTCIMGGHTHFACKNCEYEFNDDFTGLDETNHVKSVASGVYPTVTRIEEQVTFTCLGCGQDYAVQYADVYAGAYVDNTEILKRGIDVSKWNHTYTVDGGETVWQPLDWEAQKTAGVEFVIIRAGYSGSIDPTFEMAYEGAKAAGLEVGAYFYSYATTAEQASTDAEMMLTWLAGKQFELPIYLDLEDSSQAELEQSVLMELCTAFIGRLQEAGYYAALYTNTNWLHQLLDTEWIKANLDVWYARYTVTPSDGGFTLEDTEFPWKDGTSSLPGETDKRYGIWQYTDSGSIEGFQGNYDFNYAFKDYKPIMVQWGLNGF